MRQACYAYPSLTRLGFRVEGLRVQDLSWLEGFGVSGSGGFRVWGLLPRDLVPTQTVFLLFGIHGLQVAVVLTRSEDACRVGIRG